jgi:hypothetical protein
MPAGGLRSTDDRTVGGYRRRRSLGLPGSAAAAAEPGSGESDLSRTEM